MLLLAFLLVPVWLVLLFSLTMSAIGLAGVLFARASFQHLCISQEQVYASVYPEHQRYTHPCILVTHSSHTSIPSCLPPPPLPSSSHLACCSTWA